MNASPGYIKGRYLLAKHKLPSVKKSALLEFFKNELIRKYRSQIFVMGNRVIFKNATIATSGFKKGEIKIYEQEDKLAISYSLNMMNVIFLSVIFSLITFFSLFFLSHPDGYIMPLIFAVGVGVVFYSVIHIVTNMAFTYFMREKIKKLKQIEHKLAA